MTHTTTPAPRPSRRAASGAAARLPPLFATETHLLGWQGITATLPANWNLASFGGGAAAGNLRADDEDGPRLELRWERPKATPDLEQSIARFVETLARQAKKQKQPFTPAARPRLVSKSRRGKNQVVNFGWTGDREAIAGHGWGVSWHCAECGRVVVAHIIGRGSERPDRAQRLAGEILASLECHGSGGWQTWSVFGLRVEVPEEFGLARARLLTGRLELEWLRPRAGGLLAWTKRDERLALTRLSLADTLLQNETLEEWARRAAAGSDKRAVFGAWREDVVNGQPAVCARGVPRDLRRRLGAWLLDRALALRGWPRLPPPELRVWHSVSNNKIFTLRTELSPANAHVVSDVLDSLESD